MLPGCEGFSALVVQICLDPCSSVFIGGFIHEDFSSFEFQTYFRTTHANGGALYRRSGPSGGYEIQIYSVPGATNPTGSIYGIVGASDVPCRDGEWCLLRFVSDGAYTCVWVNGKKVAESHGLKLPDQGKLGFQMHSHGRIEYADQKISPQRHEDPPRSCLCETFVSSCLCGEDGMRGAPRESKSS
ncbi:MAG: hypothetical protein DMG08_25020 [Acidobacteria bacterium]|nr:MAG: hypothetical protein DMG08_25020 [Acidobacteriota bacterium]